MILNLYRCTDDRRVVSKTLTPIASNVSIVPKERLDLINPFIRLAWNSSYLSANYMYISELNRYYYISDMQLNPGHYIDIIGNIDVLKTYDAQIRSMTATIIRSESVGAPTPIPDSSLPIDPNREEIVSIILDKDPLGLAISATTENFLITVVGGGDVNGN